MVKQSIAYPGHDLTVVGMDAGYPSESPAERPEKTAPAPKPKPAAKKGGAPQGQCNCATMNDWIIGIGRAQ